jgi:tetratricopeptide (TPR) repeat protein
MFKDAMLRTGNISIVLLFLFVVSVFMIDNRIVRGMVFNLANVQFLSRVTLDHPVNISGSAPYLRAIVAFRQRRYRKAALLLQKANSNTLVRWYLAQSYNEIGEWQMALRCLTLNNSVERILYKDILFQRLPAVSEQEQKQWLEYIREVYPDMIIPYSENLLRNQDFYKAEMWAKSAPDYEQSVEALLIIGRSYYYTNRQGKAKKVFQSAYVKFPGERTAYWYGRTLLVMGESESAIPLLKESVQSAHHYSPAVHLVYLSRAYAQSGLCANAYSALEQASQEDIQGIFAEQIKSIRINIPAICQNP